VVRIKTELPRTMLICIDGESHTDKAIEWTLNIAKLTGAELTALHVRDTYLRQFYNEIYAQGRREYLDHVDQETLRHSSQAFSLFSQKAEERGVVYTEVVRTGDPLEEIVEELAEGSYDLVVVGGKPLKGIGAFKSRNLPAKLASRTRKGAILIIRSADSIPSS
jgi:nucleotide-binding universal stress UspA family protein